MSILPSHNDPINQSWHDIFERDNGKENKPKQTWKPSLETIAEEAQLEKPPVKHPQGGINYVW